MSDEVEYLTLPDLCPKDGDALRQSKGKHKLTYCNTCRRERAKEKREAKATEKANKERRYL